MKTPTLIGQIGITIALTLVCVPVTSLLQHYFLSEFAIKILFGWLILTYILYLCILAPTRPGKIILVSTTTILVGVLLTTSSSPLGLIAVAVSLFWISRILLFYKRFIPLILDVLLQTGAVCTALWVYSTNHSLLLAIWCFFLCQSLWVFIPTGAKQTIKHSLSNETNDRFSYAHRMAESALAVMFREP